MKRALLITIVLLALLPDVVKAQWTFDVVSVEAYINDHKKQRSLLLARSTLEYSNQLLHEYSRKEVGEYKELNIDLDRYRDTWGCIIVDECHRVAGTPTAVTQFSKVLSSLAAKHKYGLSATVHRADGMIAATYALLGGIAYQVPDEAVKDKIMTVSVLPRATHQGLSREFLDTDGTIIYAKLVNFLADRYPRNNLIVADLVANRDHYNLILSDRLTHLETLMNRLPPDLRKQAVMIDGKMITKKAKALREQAIEEMRQGRKRYLFATYSLAKEGLDIPRLDRLYLTTPQKDYAVITQSIGRIARTFEGKGEPIAYDYVDDGIQYLVRSYKKRCTTYRKAGCKFIDGEN